MTHVTVNTQAELDAALTNPDHAYATHEIIIDSPAGVRLTVGDDHGQDVRAFGSSTVTAYDSSTVHAYDSSTVTSYGSSAVTAYNSSTVHARGSSTVHARGSSAVTAYGSSAVRAHDSSSVTAYDSSAVRAHDSSSVTAYDSSAVHAYGSSAVTARGSSTVHARGSSAVHAYGSSAVHAYDSSAVHAYDSASVTAHGSSTVHAYDSSAVHACDSSTVTAYDSASVIASTYVAVHLHSTRVTHTGGVIIDCTTIDETDPATWGDYHGAQVESGTVTLYKCLPKNLTSGADWDRPTIWPTSGDIECADFEATDECGHGLHLSPTPGHAWAYLADESHPRFLEVTAPLDDIVPITGGTAKCKVARCTVVREVDVMGRPVTSEAAKS